MIFSQPLNWWTPIGAAVMTLSFSSCATSQLDYVDESKVAAIKQPGSVAVIGLIARDSSCQPTGRERQAILNHLETKLSQKRRKLQVMSHSEFERKVGKPRSIGSGYTGSLSYALSSSQISKAKASGATFGLVISLSKNKTWCDVGEACTTHEEPIYDKDGNEVDCKHWTEYTTTSYAYHSAKAEYLLYDLSTGQKVWASSSDFSESNTRSSCSEVCYPPPPPHPAPPTLADVMENMAAAAIRKYPR